MNLILTSEYIINIFITIIYSLHMFQLNSYSYKKHFKWMKNNYKKILLNILSYTLITLLCYIDLKIISVIILVLLIIYNLPKSKSKVPLKITNRVKRLLVTIFFICIIYTFISFVILNNNENYIYLLLALFNTLSFIICIIANLINFPIEHLGRQKYINKAKKILANRPDLIVIGVTGSYGKTSVKKFLEKTLSSKYEVLITPKNYNTTLGVVKTIIENLKPIHQVFICEMGATHVGDIKQICDIVHPKFGIITSIGPQHLESFKSIDNIIKTKFELANSVKENDGTIFLNFNNQYLREEPLNENIITYGINDTSFCYNGFDVNSSSNGLSFKILENGNNIEFKTKLIGKHNAINLIGAIAIANKLGISMQDMVLNIRNLQCVNHRLEVIPHGDLTIIDDSYNSNPISSKSALDTLTEFEGKKIIVTPGLIELGDEEEKYNFEFGENIANVCDYVFLVESNSSKYILRGLENKKFNNKKIHIVNSPNTAIKDIAKLKVKGKITVLIENDLPDNYSI